MHQTWVLNPTAKIYPLELIGQVVVLVLTEDFVLIEMYLEGSSFAGGNSRGLSIRKALHTSQEFCTISGGFIF
jgi:hypothetical protein